MDTAYKLPPRNEVFRAKYDKQGANPTCRSCLYMSVHNLEDERRLSASFEILQAHFLYVVSKACRLWKIAVQLPLIEHSYGV